VLPAAATVDRFDRTDTSPIRDALHPMQDAIDSLRVRVCGDCDERGDSRTCPHRDVPFYDVRTGEIDEARTTRAKAGYF
jgi:hypothetical protein